MAAVRSADVAGWPLRVLPGIAFVALAALAVGVSVQASHAADRQAAREAVLAAARDEVSNLVNISYRTAQRDLDRIVGGATGHLADLFEAERAQLQVLVGDRSETVGAVRSAGLMSLDADRGVARVDVAADARVTDAVHSAAQVKQYRWVLTLLFTHGRWLVSDAALAGVPQ